MELAFHRNMAREHDNPVGLGNLTQVQEQAREVWRFSAIEDLARDLAYASRRLRLSPAFTLTALLSLALGIGVNTAIFSLIDAVLLRSLAIDRPVELEQVVIAGGASERVVFSYPMFRELRARNSVFSGMFARVVAPASLLAGKRANRVVIEIASGNYFRTLGIRPLMGRFFDDDDDRVPLGGAVAVLGYRYWREHLGADAAIVGKAIRIDNTLFTVVGVAPASFFGVEVGTIPDAWVPLGMQPAVFGSGRRSFDEPMWSYLSVFGRRQPRIGTAQARAELALLFQSVNQSMPPQARVRLGELRLKPAATGISRLRDTFQEPLYILMAIVGMLLLVACANLAGLLLARSTARRREIALRLALGAGRIRLVRQLLTESLLLGIVAGGLGLIASGAAVRAIVALLPGGRMPLAIDTHIDTPVLAFAVGAAIVTGLLFGLLPALEATRPDLAAAIKDGDRTTSHGRIDLFHGFAAFQVALSLVVLSASLLFVESLRNAAAIRTGLNTADVVTASLNPALSGYTQPQVANFYQRLDAALRETRGIAMAGTAEAALLTGSGDQIQVTVPGGAGEGHTLLQNKVGGDFFDAAGIPVVAGRRFKPSDTPESPLVAIVSQTAARELFGTTAAVGRRLNLGNQMEVEIVGVAADSKYRSVREDTPPILYMSFVQERDPSRERTFYARTSGDPALAIATVRAAIRSLDPRLPVYNLKTFADQKAESLARERLIAWLSGLFAALALLLSMVGLYGAIAQTVSRRSREIGIRMSLGAAPRAMLWMIMRDALALVLAGLSGGVILSRCLGTAVGSQLYGVRPNDPAILAAACAIQVVVAILAASIPAWKASTVDPALTLRSQ
jgi:putative ABC transport system permease protein